MSLLQLPDACLVAVLRCCADDPRSVCSAGRAHSRLRKAAVEALSSITATVKQREQLDSLLMHLAAHGQHIDSISLGGVSMDEPVFLHRLPPSLLDLSSLTLSNLALRLHPRRGIGQWNIGYYQGVLGAAVTPPLKQLWLHSCTLLDKGADLAAALALLPGLEHLSIMMCFQGRYLDVYDDDSDDERGPLHISLGEVLPGLQHLAYLELGGVCIGARDDGSSKYRTKSTYRGTTGMIAFGTAEMQHLSALTRLVDLRLLGLECSFTLTASMLSAAHGLTCLQLKTEDWYHDVRFQPSALTGKTLLQHLELRECSMDVAQLLHELHLLQQLTRLRLGYISVRWTDPQEPPPAAAYSALTASSKLQHLDIEEFRVPVGVWEHMFPTSRQLPQLQVLGIANVEHAELVSATAPEGTRLVSCCPGLQSLNLIGLHYGRGLLTALQGLSSLTKLYVDAYDSSAELYHVCQLTGLQWLQLYEEEHYEGHGMLLQLTQLRQLTYLNYSGHVDNLPCAKVFQIQFPTDEPVWRQVLRLHVDHGDLEVAHHAAAALAW